MAFENLPNESRIWVYGFSHSLNDDQYTLVRERLEHFKKEWMYHGKTVTGDYEIIEKQFVVIATNEAISGCSIDSSVAVFKELKQKAQLDALNQSLIFYRDSEEVKAVDRQEFQELVSSGNVHAKTKVFNLMINHLGSFKQGNFEIDYENCWHCKVFKLPEEIAS